MVASTRYSDVIFDFCDVLVDWEPRVPLVGQVPDSVMDRLFDRDDPYGFWHYDELSDLGWSEERVLRDYAAQHGLPNFLDFADSLSASSPASPSDVVKADAAALRAFRLYFERQRMALVGMLPGMPELLHDLDAAGVRCWGLTNFTVKYVDAARELFPALGVLKDVVVSSAERIHKPDPEIFRRAIARFGVEPARTAFVDDKPWNAEAGTAAGLTGIRFTDAASLRPQLFV
ncbi:HAD-IA family hydrolase [Bifidobacterium myosotis]|uniref:HAD family hydrolase n=1 Tax=Bifidobacterium myosotis TaxID=1630166 RepID=A0A5M9ZLH3_9BIFI|nr:HAD-IA family hydrolase [Bifidobacterium myosotis]KAA8828461.1 HAD family hydrolase [Bifidobacterium myosotis]